MSVSFPKRAVQVALCCLSLSLLAFPRLVRADPPATTNSSAASELVGFAGKVEYSAPNSTNWIAARVNLQLWPGSRLRTADDSRATLQLSDRSVIRLGSNSILEIQPPAVPARHRFGLRRGILYFLDRERPADVEFETPLATGAIRGTEFLLAVSDIDAVTRLAVLDGSVDLQSGSRNYSMTNGQEILLSPTGPAKISPTLQAVNLIQWSFYYPAVLNPDEIGFSGAEKEALEKSLDDYRAGDLRGALSSAPEAVERHSSACRLYFAALKLSAGQVSIAEDLISPVGDAATPLRELIAAVKFQTFTPLLAPTNSSGWLARSYYLQSRSQLSEALGAARTAAQSAPNFGFAWARVAELEFDLNHRNVALDALAQAQKLSPHNASAVALRGFVAVADNRPNRALEFFDEALALDDSLPTAWLGHALADAAIGHDREARRELQVTAALEPQRAIYRSYLGKAWGQIRQDNLAEREFSLAKQLDPADPTAWLYSALQKFQTHQINDSIGDLEHSVELNDNRSIFRSRLQLDRDRAMRSADLATLYDAAGLTEAGQAAAYRAVDESYSDFASHLFLANSLASQEDPEQYNLRLETPSESELLIANLLAPPGGGNLSQLLSQQDRLQYFDPRPFGFSSETDYSSRGDWNQAATAFGQFRTFSYAFDLRYTSLNGQQLNNDLTDTEFGFHAKQQITPADSVYFSIDTLQRDNGDLSQYYDPTNANVGFRATEHQIPNLFVGWNHEWGPGSHTLFLISRLTDRLSLTNPEPSVLFFRQDGAGIFGVEGYPYFTLDQQEHFTLYSAEAQQIWETDHQALILGTRYQYADVDSSSTLTLLGGTITPQTVASSLQRVSGYGYYQWSPFSALRFTAGLTYDDLTYPQNVDLPPQSYGTANHSLFGPKVGVIAEPWQGGWLHAAWARSLGGLFFDNSIRLEPDEVAGAISTYRSLVPESVEGLVPGTRFDSWTAGFDQTLHTKTYLGIEAELLESEGSRSVGAFSNAVAFVYDPTSPTSTSQELKYRERNLSAYLAQLVGKDISVGARYRISEARLETDLPSLAGIAGVSSLNQNQRAVLQHGQLFLIYNHPSGFFAEWSSDWFHQDNHGDLSSLPGDDFWMQNVFVGYVFAHRRAELQLGVLNLTDQNYHLDPLNWQSELARTRTFTASLRINY
ncbi:MAG TPA: FecR domain-containing protein [Verrucomicrobiae bacterium]|nr:FecR domain-containing protein [Verrucomicrobiae bacterium]